MRLIAILLAAFIFVGSAVKAQTLLDEQCDDAQCEEQKKGYGWAKQNYIGDVEKCNLRENASEDFLMGCQTYVDDVLVGSTTEEGLPQEIGPADEEEEAKPAKPKKQAP